MSWLDGRRPAAPQPLAERLRHVAHRDEAVDARANRLLDAARAHLDDARARPGRVRESAFDLLLADALVTYASEAALESDDPDAALRALISIGVAR